VIGPAAERRIRAVLLTLQGKKKGAH
jgi:hypothetical protein